MTVGRYIRGNLVHTLAYADEGCQMENRVHARQGSADGIRVAHIAAEQLDFTVEISRSRAFRPVDLRYE